MKIRAFQSNDTASVVVLWEACNLTRPWNNPELDIARKCSVDDGLFLVGELDRQTRNESDAESDKNGDTKIDNEIVATIMGSYDGHRGWIYYLAVHPEQQRKGYGEQMMNEMEARLLALGCPKINLQIRRENSSVMTFYESLGFTEDASVSLGKRLIPDN